MTAGTTERFYADLKPFSDFAGIASFADYVDVPDDWIVMITDVVSSTSAIAEGRYKDVNMVGAATITAILNIARELSLPFDFGGDGAVVLVPPTLAERARSALASLRHTASEVFSLDLRAAAIPVADLRAQGAELRIRRFELTPGNFLAMFSGGAIQKAEAILKDKKRVLPSIALLQGEYGYENLFMGVPTLLGANGIEKVFELELTPEEKQALDKSAQSVRNVIRIVEGG